MSFGDADAVFVEASARLHFGVLDLRGDLGRWFGGIGAAAPGPRLLVSAAAARDLRVSGDDAARAAGFARRALDHLASRHGRSGGADVSVRRSLPPHAGLGSGTQLALSVGRALMELYGVGADVAEIASAVGRVPRSAIGTHAFAGGGLIVEGGRSPGSDEVPPLVARLPFPASWWCVVGVPDGEPGVSGEAEREAFAELPPPPVHEVERVAHLVLMGLLPALADADLRGFGEALCAIQSITGRWFAPVQGGVFASDVGEDLARAMAGWGARGVGQSSWGPAVYGIVGSEEEGRRLGSMVRNLLGTGGRVYEGPFPAEGARVWRDRAPSEAGRAQSLEAETRSRPA